MVDLGCPGETVETTAAISSGTFVLLLRLRRAGVLSSAVEEIEEGTPELYPPVFFVWRRSGRCCRPCGFAGLRQADLVFFLDAVDGSGRIRRSTTSLGLSPDRRATVISAAPSGASVARFIKPFPAMELRRLLGAMVSVFSSPGGRSAAPAVRVAVVWVVQSFLQFVRAFVFFSFVLFYVYVYCTILSK
jgi:hypothetical protein